MRAHRLFSIAAAVSGALVASTFVVVVSPAVAAPAPPQSVLTVAGDVASIPTVATPVSIAAELPDGTPNLVAAVPTISGTPAVGRRLTAISAKWAPAPVALSYQWQRAGAPIARATSTTYLVTAADAGAQITVSITGEKMGFPTLQRTSAPAVIGLQLGRTPRPKIAGSSKIGRTLVATAGTWAPSDVRLGFQWLRNGVPIPGATAPEYTVTGHDARLRISVRVTGSTPGYTSVSRVSATTAVGRAPGA